MIHDDSFRFTEIWSSIHISVTVFKVQLAMLTNDSFKHIPPHTHIYIYIYIYMYIYNSYNILYIHIGSRQHPLHLSSCYCYGYRFWGGLSLSRVLWKSAYSRSNMKPKSIPRQLGNGSRSCFVGFRCFGNTPCSFHVAMLHSFACIFLRFPFICMHVPFMLHSCPFISFLKLWKWLYGLARGQRYNKWLSLTYR